MSTAAPAGLPPRFAPGARVRVADRPAQGHCRTPFYLRGQPGTVLAHAGAWRDPERLAYHKPGLPALHLYRVRFDAAVLRPARDGATAWGAQDVLLADIYENWLEPADADTEGAAGAATNAGAPAPRD